jgi:hypothetical protein
MSAMQPTAAQAIGSVAAPASVPAGPTPCLILGDQLNPLHAWFVRPDPRRIHVLLERRQEADSSWCMAGWLGEIDR